MGTLNVNKMMNTVETQQGTNDATEHVFQEMGSSNKHWESLEQRIISLQSLYDTLVVKQNNLKTTEQYYISEALGDTNVSKDTLDNWINNSQFTTYNPEKITKINIYYDTAFVYELEYTYLSKSEGDLEEVTKSVGYKQQGNSVKKITLKNTEYLTSLIVKPAPDNTPYIARQISIFTSYSSITPKEKLPDGNLETALPKTLQRNLMQMTWNWHDNYAKSIGKELVCINSREENDQVKRFAGTNIWIGLYHNNGGSSDKNDPGWTWVDGSKYNHKQWHRGEPNNCCNGEPKVNMWVNGDWNDHNVNAIYAAVYQKRPSSSENKAISNFSEQILEINTLNPISVEYVGKFIHDTEGENAARQASEAVTTTNNVLLESLVFLDRMYDELELTKQEIQTIIEELVEEQNHILELQDIGKDAQLELEEYETIYGNNQDPFMNMKNNNTNFIENIIKFFNNIFTNNRGMKVNFKEGFNDDNPDQFQYGTGLTFDQARANNAELLTELDNLRDREMQKYVSELLIKRNNLFTNTVMDYMIHNNRGTDVNKIYNKVKQKNINTNRQVGINMYYSKMYKEYINIIKVIVIACALIIPVLILNSNYIIPKNITMFLVTVIIIFLVGFIIYKMYDVNYRDYKNFDKIKIPYDREAQRLIREGKLDEFENPLLGNLTCIADACCDVSMVYDNKRNKCVLENKIVENFLGENFNNKELFSNRDHFKCDIVQELLSESLLRSGPNSMNESIYFSTETF